MGLPGRQRRVITFEKNKATIDEDAITRIILHPEVKHRKIVSLSIVGAFRKGKSFLLDYVLRYLYYTVRFMLRLNLVLYIYFNYPVYINKYNQSAKQNDWKAS